MKEFRNLSSFFSIFFFQILICFWQLSALSGGWPVFGLYFVHEHSKRQEEIANSCISNLYSSTKKFWHCCFFFQKNIENLILIFVSGPINPIQNPNIINFGQFGFFFFFLLMKGDLMVTSKPYMGTIWSDG